MIEEIEGIQIIKHANYSKSHLNNPICICGMPGIADVGKFAIDSLIGQLKAKSYMEIINCICCFYVEIVFSTE